MGVRESRLGVLLALCISASVDAQTVVEPETVGLSSQKLALVRDALKLHIDNGQIPGGIVLIQRNGKVALLDAQGKKPSGQPLTADTVFGLASLSKPVTAVAVLMLVDDGKIGLDDPVSKFIPEFGAARRVRVLKPGSPPPPFSPLPGVLPAASEGGPPEYEVVSAQQLVTVRMLLNHTSGIQIFGVPNDGLPQAKPGETLADVVPRMASALLEYQPGSRWAYSNAAGYEVLSRIVEVASGQPYNVFLKQRLFDPLGMQETDFGVRPEALGRAVHFFPTAPIPAVDGVTYFSGAAGLWSTISDYARFAQMLTAGGTAEGRVFLKPGTLKLLTSNQIGTLLMGGYPPMALPPEGVKFGLGVLTVVSPQAAGTQVPAGSFGWDGVGSRRFWSIPSQNITIVMMAPPIGPSAAPFHRDVESAVMSALLPPN